MDYNDNEKNYEAARRKIFRKVWSIGDLFSEEIEKQVIILVNNAIKEGFKAGQDQARKELDMPGHWLIEDARKEGWQKAFDGKEDLLANLIHEEWMFWAKTILKTETISQARQDRWKKFFVSYEELPEVTKEEDRVWARKVIEALRKGEEGK